MRNLDAVRRDINRRIGDGGMARLCERVDRSNRLIAGRGIRRDAWDGGPLLTGYAYEEVYDWDLFFECVWLSHFGVHGFCRHNARFFLSRQLPDGFISRTAGVRFVKPRQHFKPFLAQTVWLGMRQSGDDWMEVAEWEALRQYHDHWTWFHDHDRNGLCVWDSADHSGMDNQFSRAGVEDTNTREGVDLNSYLVREARALACIAERRGEGDTAAAYRREAADRLAAIDRLLWDDRAGFYFDRDERTGERVPAFAASGLMRLWAGDLPAGRAERLIEHLLDEAKFNTPWPIATYARSEPDYYQAPRYGECNWRGPAWVPVNYAVAHSLARLGHRDEALALAWKTFDLVMNQDEICEFYDAETGEGYGLRPFWGWSVLGMALPIELLAGYHPDDPDKPTQPLLQQVTGVAPPLEVAHAPLSAEPLTV